MIVSVNKHWLQFLVLYSSALNQELSIHAQLAFVFSIYLPTSDTVTTYKAPVGVVILRHLRRSVRVTDQTVYIATTMTMIQKLGLG